MYRKRSLQTLAVFVLALSLVGCAAQRHYRRAEVDARRQNWDRAVLGYSKAVALDPGNTRYSVALERAKLNASSQHFEKGKQYMAAKQYELAAGEFQQTLLLNPGNQHAANELAEALREIRRRDEEPSEIERMKAAARRRRLAPPKLDPRSNIPIVMMFRDQPVEKIFEAISKASGINFLYDEKVDLKRPITIDIGNVTLEKALDILMLQTKNFYKVIDENTILLAPDNRQKRQEYEDQVIRTFFLSNGETKQVVTLLRTLLNSRQIAENADLNSVTIKDAPDKVAIAERIINANDKSRGEVIVDVELLEINRTVSETLGIDLSTKTLSIEFEGGVDGRLALNNLSALKQQGSWTIGVIPSVLLNFIKSDSDSRTIAKPQLRVSEGEKAEILIGDRVPIPTTSFNTSQTIGGNIVPITSFTYQNVGITVQIEPRVHHNKEITLKVSVEVSQIASFVETAGNQRQPIIGTRSIQTVIRLRDGETNLLAGLIRREDSDTLSGVPGLSDIPGLNRVFGNTTRSNTETDIVLTLTPHIIRIPDITDDDLATLWVGTEDNMRLRGPAKDEMGRSPFGSDGDKIVITGETPPVGVLGPGDTVAEPEEEEEEEFEPELEEDEEAAEDEEFPPGEEEEDEERTEDESTEEEERDFGPALVRLLPTAPGYRVGDRVAVEVVIENANGVGSIPFHLRYNRSVLEFVPPATEGPFLGGDGARTVFLASDSVGGGEIVVGLSRMGSGDGISGSGSVATIEFQAINPGDCGFAFTGQSVKDPRAQDLPASFVAMPVQVAP